MGIYCNYCKNIYLERNIKNHVANCKKREINTPLKGNGSKEIIEKRDINLHPKMIQNQLLKDKKYITLLNELDILIIELLKLN